MQPGDKHLARVKKKISFDEFYGELYPGRWRILKESLLAPPAYEELTKGFNASYFLDRASYLAASSLGVLPGDKVLDLCAAPGGKTLVLVKALRGGGSLTANERSADRRGRLVRVLREHLPPEDFALVRVTGFDARTWGMHEKNVYGKILLDAPCSSERHVIASPHHLDRWTPARTRHLAQQAYVMLLSALAAAAPGARVLYCTCSISPLENDGVIERVLSRLGSGVTLIDGASQAEPCAVEGCEKTARGLMIMPDVCGGMGPLYTAKLEKSSVFP